MKVLQVPSWHSQNCPVTLLLAYSPCCSFACQTFSVSIKFLNDFSWACTVPFQLIRQSRVTGPYGPALILVHVTCHIDFGRMGKMVQKKKFNYLRYISFYRYDIWLYLSQINFLSVANSVCHRSYRKWSQCQNATAVSQVTSPDESIEMVQYWS